MLGWASDTVLVWLIDWLINDQSNDQSRELGFGKCVFVCVCGGGGGGGGGLMMSEWVFGGWVGDFIEWCWML